MADIKKLPQADQERWLEQRGWVPTMRSGVKMWKHPDTGVPYWIGVAVDKAIDACKLPADMELNPVLPPPNWAP